MLLKLLYYVINYYVSLKGFEPLIFSLSARRFTKLSYRLMFAYYVVIPIQRVGDYSTPKAMTKSSSIIHILRVVRSGYSPGNLLIPQSLMIVNDHVKYITQIIYFIYYPGNVLHTLPQTKEGADITQRAWY